MKIDEYVEMAEKRIHGKGSTISNWYSYSRGSKLSGVRADLLVKGNMAVKGFLISRMWSWNSPRWETLALVFSHKGREKASVEQLTKLIECTENYMSKNFIKWAWLVWASEIGFDDETVGFVKARFNKEIGIMLVDLSSKAFFFNNILVNKHGVRVFKP